MKKLALIVLMSISLFGNALQNAIDGASENDIIELPAGVFKGNIVIDKPLTITSNGDATIEGTAEGSTIIIKSSHVTIKGVTLKNSGKNKATKDSAIIAANVEQLEISNNKILNAFNGVTFLNVSNSLIENNTVVGLGGSIVDRGDGFFIYEGQNNIIKNNNLSKIRDLLVDYSYNNKILNNKIVDARYGMHGMNASGNHYEGNHISDAIAGLYFMYNINYTVVNNTVINSKGDKGIGMGLIECSDFHIERNHLIYNTVGIMLDGSPDKYDSKNMITKNNIAFCSEAFRFKEIQINSATPRGTNHFIANNIYDNITDVVDESNGKELAIEGNWEGNYWDSYKGYDINKDGIGDIPYELFYFSDVVWMDYPDAKFFFNSVAMSIMDFLGRLAPTRDPYIVLIDNKPKIEKGDYSVK